MPAIIKLIGVNHNDPFGRERIVEFLKEEQNNGFYPDCLATEWKRSVFERVKKQRTSLYNELVKAGYNDLEAHLFADAMGFEADSHMAVFPNIPIIWLDEGRSVSEDAIISFAKKRFETIIAYSKKEGKHLNIRNTRRALLATAKHEDDDIPDGRDDIFASQIKEAVERGAEKIICIVGQKHTDTETYWRLGSLLCEAGYSVSVNDTTGPT